MKEVEEQLDEFLVTPNMKVVSLKGEWGVGKTYFWNRFLAGKKEELKKEGALKGYSYVSVFGLSSIAEIRSMIVARIDVFSDKLLRKGVTGIGKFSKVLKAFKANGVSGSFMHDVVQNYMLNDLLICIDDLERKEDSVSTSSILGLMSELTEQKNCKMVLIYNDEDKALDQKSIKEIEEYREKVIDLEISYKPSLKENIALVWPNDPPSDLERIFKVFGCNNIRIMQKIKSSLEYFKLAFEEKYLFLWNRFSLSVIVLCIWYNRHQNEVSIEDLDSFIGSTNNALIFNNSSSTTESVKMQREYPELSGILHDLSYHVNEFDEIVVQYLKNGFVDINEYEDLLTNEDYYAKKWEAKSRSDELWSKHRSLCGYTQNEFINDHVQLLENDGHLLGLRQVFYEVKFLCELQGGLTDYQIVITKKLFDFYVGRMSTSKLKEDFYREDIIPSLPEEIKELWQNSFEKKNEEKNISLHEAMKEIIPASNSYNPEMMFLLKGYTVEDYIQWISTESESQYFLKRFYDGFIYRKLGDHKDVEMVSSCVEEAVKSLKDTDNYNKQRFSNFLKQR